MNFRFTNINYKINPKTANNSILLFDNPFQCKKCAQKRAQENNTFYIESLEDSGGEKIRQKLTGDKKKDKRKEECLKP